MAFTFERLSTNNVTWSAKATGAGNIAESLSPGSVWDVREIRLHLSALGDVNDFTVTLNSNSGAIYDVKRLSQNMVTVIDLIESFESNELRLHPSDALDFAWTNGSSVTWGLEILYNILG